MKQRTRIQAVSFINNPSIFPGVSTVILNFELLKKTLQLKIAYRLWKPVEQE